MNDGVFIDIYAKPNETLMEHTENTLKVFKSLKHNYPDIPELCGVPEFWECLFYTLFFHDFGKATVGFQKALFEDNAYWPYRHEILSAAFMKFASFTSDSGLPMAVSSVSISRILWIGLIS